jgi:hypothetical protein
MPSTVSEGQQDLEGDRREREERLGRFAETFRHGAIMMLLALSK